MPGILTYKISDNTFKLVDFDKNEALTAITRVSEELREREIEKNNCLVFVRPEGRLLFPNLYTIEEFDCEYQITLKEHISIGSTLWVWVPSSRRRK